ncbi:HAD family hydrolase [Umezawaea tangerina]|uniref:Phosphoglycolate phosphatase-like HAD superfamily hydrolase n=1 Tax=Umezawaea tangerina TaxID=84725 RepID=A0A2T0SKQ5_9PSEU|nr:HAD hydrolase-like protein [Umezawaea tangerina]PRY33975.1 phosphoglycolate phosphatase-like HAD superfamily hydrolase [Umezawaea tangerina]
MEIKHVVWDWNGTLLADNDAVLSAVNAVCAGFGRTAITLEHWRSTFSRPLQQCYEQLLAQELDAAAWSRIDAIYHDHYRDLLSLCTLADGVPEHLHAWGDLGRTQSLLSMWYHHELVALVEEFRLTGLFTRIDGLREGVVGGGSKAAHLAEHLAAQDLDPADVVLIGDVVDDAEAAAHVGASCVLVTTGVMSRAKLEAAGVPVADSISEALHLVR